MQAFPGTSCEAEAPFDPGYAGLDAGAKASQPVVNPLTATHVFNLKTSFLGKTDVFYFHAFGGFQIFL
jgi:hypothetical protein